MNLRKNRFILFQKYCPVNISVRKRTRQYLSFIDIIGAKFSEIKTGFSGTPIIDLPQWNTNEYQFKK